MNWSNKTTKPTPKIKRRTKPHTWKRQIAPSQSWNKQSSTDSTPSDYHQRQPPPPPAPSATTILRNSLCSSTDQRRPPTRATGENQRRPLLLLRRQKRLQKNSYTWGTTEGFVVESFRRVGERVGEKEKRWRERERLQGRLGECEAQKSRRLRASKRPSPWRERERHWWARAATTPSMAEKIEREAVCCKQATWKGFSRVFVVRAKTCASRCVFVLIENCW